MSGPLLRSGECRKFAPNIFNKTKCTNCFRQKEEHSAEALESNRATRKVAKCGYLFVAPGWDFTNPLNRTKRWQRRWFVLYDDGELSYALDEHPETVPQASIDMNKVLEVADAEDVTGNAYSLAITAPDNVHFVKGTCREEARWWNEVLSVFPRSKGRPKRNATFPGSQTSSSSPTTILQTPPVRDVSSSLSSDLGQRYLPGGTWESEDVFPTRDLTVSSAQSSPIETPPQPTSLNNRKVYMGSPPTRDKVPRSEEKGRTRRVQNREKRGLKTGRSYSEDLTKMLPTWCDKKTSPPSEHPEVSRRLLLEEFESECKLKDIADSLTRPRQHRRLTSPALTPPPPSNHEPTRDSDTTTHKQVRGDPDGCGLDLSSLRYSPSSELRVELPAEDLLNIKKGWLMKQGNDKEWNKHWFVLRGAALLYYRDPSAEDQGILDGVIDLSGISAVTEVQVARNYGFQMATWDERNYVLSAVTSGIRANWMAAIRRAAGLDTKMDTTSVQMERDRENAPPTPLTGRSIIFSSDDEYRTASEGRRESGEWGDTLPPSPPLNRTPISKVKERARGGMRGRSYHTKRSRSSPPSSRRSTLDSVPQEDLILSCCGEAQESDVDENLAGGDKDTLLDRVRDQSAELQDVRRQLTSVLRELSSAEEELLRLRQRKIDVSALETQIEELLQRVEDANKQRARDSSELDSFKKRYLEDKARYEQRIYNDRCELEKINQRYSQICAELSDSAKLVQRLREELSSTDDLTRHLRDELESVTNRLAAGIEENDQLYRRLRDLEARGQATPPHPRSRSVDSLSDLTNIQLDLDLAQLDKDRVIEEYSDLRARFEKAVVEIRVMKRELRESQAQTDCLELSLINLRQDSKARQEATDSQTALMAARVQDLAMKLCNAEKQIRALKQKLSKSETREKRRSLSLKGRESFTIGKELEDKLTELESKISALTMPTTNVTTPPSKSPSPTKSLPPPAPSSESSKVSSRLRRKSLDSATCSEPMKILLRFSSLEAKVAKASKEIIICPSSPSPSSQPSTESIVSLDEVDHKNLPLELKLFNGVHESDEVDGNSQMQHHVYSEIKKMETLLRSKLTEISKKRDSLIASGQWTNEARVSLLAEKLAFESVLVGRLHDAVTGSAKGDICNVERFMTELDAKLTGWKPNMKTSLDYLAKALTRHLLNQNIHKVKPRKFKDKRKANDCSAFTELNQKKKSLDHKVEVFVNQAVDQLAAAFANETLSDDTLNGGETKIQAAWSLAQEAVNEELIQAEISQVMSQCSKTYQNIVDEEKENRLISLFQERASLELWSKATVEYLHKEMDVAVKRLHDKYTENLFRLKSQHSPQAKTRRENEEKSRVLLKQFVDVIAHKALLDARLSLLQDLDLDISESYSNLQEIVYDENVVLAEMQNLYLKYFEELQNSPEKVNVDNERLKEAMSLLVKEVTILKDYLVGIEQKRPRETDKIESRVEELSFSENLCEQCHLLKDEVKQLQQLVIKVQDCQRCEYLQQEIKRREMQFEEEMHELKMQQEEELARLKAELEQDRINLVCQHEVEQTALKDRARKLERRLGTLDSEYSQQMENLRAAYHKTLSSTLDRDLPGGENIRQRYKAEIEHLRALCEKGLIGMENSHRRMIAELEEKHRQESEQLRREKELALAEETQATLAALDAMRKAHQAEVAREVAKFKQEFLTSMRQSQDINALHREHEAEMEEIKKEILSLSEKYSVKCVESAALEEQLREANDQLSQAQQHILQLDSRNKQLRAHLVSEVNDSSSADFICLEEKEKPLNSCWRGGKPDTIAAALAMLHCRQTMSGVNVPSEPPVSQTSIQDPSSLHKAEAKRNPTTVQDFLSPSLCTVSGMVAERKKLFEH